MNKYRVRIIEEVTATYDWVEIEAETRDEAVDIAEEYRVQGHLGKPSESVDDVPAEVQKLLPGDKS